MNVFARFTLTVEHEITIEFAGAIIFNSVKQFFADLERSFPPAFDFVDRHALIDVADFEI